MVKKLFLIHDYLKKEERVSVGDCQQMYGQESGVNQQLNVEEFKTPIRGRQPFRGT